MSVKKRGQRQEHGAPAFLRAAPLFAFLLCISFRAWAGSKLIGSTEDIPRNLIANAGGTSSGGTYLFDGSVGEVAIATAASGSYGFESGLENIFAQPGSLVALSTAVLSTSTGTLVLQWNAPGLNGGIQGGNGYYRIDYSSSPAQAVFFDPTASNPAYVVQFATSVVPGQAQSYALQNLVPNTTYYARVYLGDETKFFAETSSTAAYSTLANLPVSPVLTGVAYTSVTFTWSFPSGGAEGYDLAGSSIGFGAIPFASSVTANGGLLTLTVSGLNPGGTYYFSLASLNWQGLSNYETLIETVTLPTTVPPVDFLALSSAPVVRTITLTWTWYSPRIPNENGAVVLVSSMPISATLAQGVAYAPGQTLGDGSVVASTRTGVASGGALVSTVSFTQAGLTLDTTEYFSIYNSNALNNYSAAVSTSAALDLPPLAPAGLATIINPSVSSMTIAWSQVKSKTDGTFFHNPLSPGPWELSGYDVYRSTGLIHPTWVLVSTLAASAVSDQEAMAPAGMVYYYKIVSLDSFPGQTTDQAMAVDTLGNLYALDSDNITRIEIPAAMAGIVQPNGNSSGQPLLFRVADRPQDVASVPYIYKSVSFEPYQAPSNEQLASLSLPSGTPANSLFDIALGYEVQNGQIMASGLPKSAPLSESNIPLGLFWYNGQQPVKMVGSVDSANNEVMGQTGILGDYRLQSFEAPTQASFDPGSNMSTKVITPTATSCSGEVGCDDHVEMYFPNPAYLGYSGIIYDVRGFKVADMAQTGCSGPWASGGPGAPNACLVWNGRGVNGAVVARGVYIYEIKVGGQTWTGTVVVLR